MVTPTLRTVALAIALLSFTAPGRIFAQEPEAPATIAELKQEAAELKALVAKLEHRIDLLENPTPPIAIAAAKGPEAPAVAITATPAPPAALPATSKPNPFEGTTFNVLLDTYYEYNFNSPIGRANLLRAYDVSSNSFSLNQAAVVVENAPDPDAGKRWGMRLDLQYGQATQTLQGNSVNEPRPDIYREIFQAYGTYVAPVGKGLTIDFGKWSSSLGIEGNYTKDQNNYSRSLWFDFLPFYHMGVRATYNVTDKFAAHYWITNGTEQTEAFNGFKDQSFGFAWQPNKAVNWTMNYYLGQEHADVTYFPNGVPAGIVNPPVQQGVPFEPISQPPTGKLHILDSYITWQASPKLSFAAEGDWVLERDFTTSAPARVDGGAGYARYQLTPKVAIGARAEYLSDRSGLFSGTMQELKEATFTTDYKVAEGLLLRWEWRRDFSNHPYFYTDTLGLLKRDQTTAGLGVVWWFGAKSGIW
jgi:hypothetical protein